MKNLLPIPSIEAFPKAIKDNPEIQTLAGFIDAEIKAYFNSAFGLETLKDPSRVPSQFLNEFGYFLSADIFPEDDDRVKREKILKAVVNNKLRGTWASVKNVIDSIVNKDSKILDFLGSDSFTLCGGYQISTDFIWSVLGGAGPTNYGIRLEGNVGVVPQKGVILIDIDDSTLTTEQVETVKYNIINFVPSYFKVYLGYVSGIFISYPNGIIG